MDLTDEQWALISPLIPPPSPYSRGRPPADPRATLNGIFRKLRLAAPWYDLPPYAVGCHPSWQTCYRRYRRWQRSGLMDEIYRLLYQDLRDRAGLDLLQALQVEDTITRGINPACGEGTITLSWDENGWLLRLPSGLEGTWQGSTVHLLVQVILARIKQNRRYQFPHKLTITFSG